MHAGRGNCFNPSNRGSRGWLIRVIRVSRGQIVCPFRLRRRRAGLSASSCEVWVRGNLSSQPHRGEIDAREMKTAALIGISGYARHHLLVALEQALHGRLRLVAATVVNAAAEEFFCDRLRALGCEIFTSADAMWDKFAGRIDLCLIPTGLHLHAPM